MGRRIVSVTSVTGDGTTIDLDKVQYIDKVYREGKYGLKITFHGGGSRTIWYGMWYGDRDNDFNALIQRL